MIVIRYTFVPSDNWQKARDLFLNWRESHPEEHLRVYNSITSRQRVLVVERTFADDDAAGLARALFNPAARLTPEERAWWQEWQALDIPWETRELWRLYE